MHSFDSNCNCENQGVQPFNPSLIYIIINVFVFLKPCLVVLIELQNGYELSQRDMPSCAESPPLARALGALITINSLSTGNMKRPKKGKTKPDDASIHPYVELKKGCNTISNPLRALSVTN